MVDLTQLTPAELNKLTKDQLIAHILEGQTYTEMDPLVKDEFGNNLNHGWRVRDSLTGNLISTHRVTWSYYDAKEGTVNEITVQEGNRQQVIKHTLDGKQPTLTTRIVIEKTLGDTIFEAAAGGVTGAASGTKNLIVRAKDAIVGLFRA